MNSHILGLVHRFGDNINTDIISPPQYMELGIEEAAKHAMEAVAPGFAANCKPGDILVAGKNLGSGSSRETSPLTLKHLGISAVVAQFFARIFYRNCINLGLPSLICGQTDRISDRDEIEIHMEEGRIVNLTKKEDYKCSKIPPHIGELLECGGLVNYLHKKLGS